MANFTNQNELDINETVSTTVCNICFESYATINALKDHLRSHTGEEPFQCEICMKCFVEKLDFMQHKETHTYEIGQDQLLCIKQQESQKALVYSVNGSENHERTQTELTFQCDICQKLLSSKKGLIKHKKLHTGELSVLCNTCGKVFSCMRTFEEHEKIHTGEKPFQCDICMKCYSTKPALRQHKASHVLEKPQECKTCQKQFPCVSALKRHLKSRKVLISVSSPKGCEKTYTCKSTFQCEICLGVFPSKRTLVNHGKRHSGESSVVPCNVCGIFFPSTNSLDDHKRVHTGEEPFQCEISMKCFVEKSDFGQHKETYVVEKSLEHEIGQEQLPCVKQLEEQKNLVISANAAENQERTHTLESTFQCEICEKLFSSKGNLVKHRKLHSGESSLISCNICGRFFSSKYSLEDHRRIHTGEKPFQCDICMKCFSTKTGLKKHTYTHTLEKPLECEICQEQFLCVSALKRHSRIHISSQPSLVCEICTKTLSSLGNLKRHMELHANGKI